MLLGHGGVDRIGDSTGSILLAKEASGAAVHHAVQRNVDEDFQSKFVRAIYEGSESGIRSLLHVHVEVIDHAVTRVRYVRHEVDHVVSELLDAGQVLDERVEGRIRREV